MTKQQAKIILLESYLIDAQYTVEFLHNCLTNKKLYKYKYPKETLDSLKRWNKAAPTYPLNLNSSKQSKELERFLIKAEKAKKILSI